jgi:predicted amidohydrolase YtcJ
MFASDTRTALAVLIAASATVAGCSRPPQLSADLVITHALVWTGVPSQRDAAAVAIIGERIVDVGATEQIDRWRGATTTVVDAGGRRVVPGFNDAAVRLVDGGLHLDGVDLHDAPSAAEMARRINERAKARPGEWITGGDWDERSWNPPSLPVRASIDEVTNSSPVFVTRFDGTMALANAAAMGRAGITERTPDPPGGSLVRDGNGFPTGVLQGSAMDLVARVVPKTTSDDRARAIKRALAFAESLGITSVQDLGATADDIAVYADLANRRELTVRIYALTPDLDWYDEAKLGLRRAFGSPWLRLGGVHARLAPMTDAGERQTRLMAADHAGLQISIDPREPAGTGAALDLFDAIARTNGGRDRRFRLAAPALAPADRHRLAGLHAVAPLGSGWPAAPLNPMLTLQAALAQPLTVPEALASLTSGNAFAEFQEQEKGTIARGQLADLVVLSDDLFSMPAASIRNVRVLTTITGGQVVHQRKP